MSLFKPFIPSCTKWYGSIMSNTTSFTNVVELNVTTLENNLIVLRRQGLKVRIGTSRQKLWKREKKEKEKGVEERRVEEKKVEE